MFALEMTDNERRTRAASRRRAVDERVGSDVTRTRGNGRHRSEFR